MDSTQVFILEQKLELWRSVADATMLWWVSSIVLCFSIIGLVWINQRKIENHIQMIVLGVAILLFFIFTIMYGLVVDDYIPRLRADMNEIFNIQPNEPSPFETELDFFQNALFTGILDFGGLIALWLIMWPYMHWRIKIRRKESLQESPTEVT